MLSTKTLIRLSPETREEIGHIQCPGDKAADIARKLFYARAAAAHKKESEEAETKEKALV